MELKNLVTKYIYRIEPKPGGGFIAHAGDPSIPPLEAPTRLELQQKIQSTVMAGLANDFPGFRFPVPSSELKFDFHIERNPNGGFDVHSSDGSAPIPATSHDEVESHFAEKLLGFASKHLAPEFAQALAAQGATGDIKVWVRKSGFTVTTGGHNAAPAIPALAQPDAAQSTNPAVSSTVDGGIVKDSSFVPGPTPISSSPITPGQDRSGSVFRFFLALLVVAAVIYLLLHHH